MNWTCWDTLIDIYFPSPIRIQLICPFFIYIYTYLHICIFVSDRSSAIRETERVVLPVGLCIKRLSNICLGNIIRAQYLYRQVQCKCKIIRKAQSKAKLCQSHAIINFIIVIIISYFFFPSCSLDAISVFIFRFTIIALLFIKWIKMIHFHYCLLNFILVFCTIFQIFFPSLILRCFFFLTLFEHHTWSIVLFGGIYSCTI